MAIRLEAAIAGCLGGILTATSLVAQQVPLSPFPRPTGRFAVGRTSVEWIDQSRTDSTTPSRHRELVVWIWYPTAEPRAGSETAQWMPGKLGELFWARFLEEDSSLAEGGKTHPMTSIRTHAYNGAAVARGSTYPLILFAPGTGGAPPGYASVIEDLVSHGYIVVGLGSPEFDGATVYANGRVVLGHDVTAGRGAMTSPFESAVDLVSTDVRFALDELSRANTDARSLLNGALDLTRVGAFGHSLGGAAMLQAAHDDPRIRAIVDLDGSRVWKSSNGPLGKPLLIISAASTRVAYGAALTTASPPMQLRIAGTEHMFSTDLGLLPFIPSDPAPAGIPVPNPARNLSITAAYTSAFFDQYLKGVAAPLLNGPSPTYPEVKFELPKRP